MKRLIEKIQEGFSDYKMVSADDAVGKFKKHVSFDKETTIKTFEAFWKGDFEIIDDGKSIKFLSDLPLHFDVEYENDGQKEGIFAFLMYLAQKFDFSFHLNFEDYDKLEI